MVASIEAPSGTVCRSSATLATPTGWGAGAQPLVNTSAASTATASSATARRTLRPMRTESTASGRADATGDGEPAPCFRSVFSVAGVGTHRAAHRPPAPADAESAVVESASIGKAGAVVLVGFDDCRAVVLMPSAACRGWNPDESSQVTGHSESSSGGIRSRRLRRAVEPGLLLILAISVAGTAAALSLDVVGALGSVKGDEATYVMMALSAAHDGDMVYESTDLSRFYRLYQGGPEGLFLKREAGPGAPGQLFFAKAWLHAVVAAPFVGCSGSTVCWC